MHCWVISSITNRAISRRNSISVFHSCPLLSTAEARGPHTLWLHSLPCCSDARPHSPRSHTQIHVCTPTPARCKPLINHLFLTRLFPRSLTPSSGWMKCDPDFDWYAFLARYSSSTARMTWPQPAGSQWIWSDVGFVRVCCWSFLVEMRSNMMQSDNSTLRGFLT